MKRLGAVVLALVTGALFPVLIWVALGVALREPLVRATWRVSSALCALSSGFLSPVLDRAGLGDAMRQFLLRWERSLQRKTSRSIGELLAEAGLGIRMEISGGKTAPALLFERRPITEIYELLARAGCESQQYR